jgi:Uncharacterized conserved protein (DUF2278)
MALDHGYGVAVGTYASFTREDSSSFGHWYHGKLRINTPAGQYEAALDVDTPSGVGVSYRLVTDLTTANIPVLAALGNGFTPLASSPPSGALDYVRSPILRDGWVVSRLRQWQVEHRKSPLDTQRWGPTALNRLMAGTRRWLPKVGQRLRWPFSLRWRSFAWVSSDGDNALDVLEQHLSQAVRIYILGEPYTTGLGVHNVHLNQGDPDGQHQAEDGIWQDGAVIIQLAGGRVTIWQVKFNTQSLVTNELGLPVRADLLTGRHPGPASGRAGRCRPGVRSDGRRQVGW